MMSGNWFSPVQIENSSVLAAGFKVEPVPTGCKTQVSMNVSAWFDHHDAGEESYMCDCILHVLSALKSQDGDSEFFSTECKLGMTISCPMGYFPEDSPIEERKLFLEANVVSLAYGKIRSFIENMTAESEIGRQTIPAIDPYALIESLKEDEQS